ncbi:acyltransferase [bacterium]|nr:acyltransferase [bacterium]
MPLITPSTTPAPNPGRDTALDNLRVVAMLLGLVTHGALPFIATGILQFPIRDATRHPGADAAYIAVHDFRMQLFFLLAGFAAASLAARRGVGAVVRNRLVRVAVPLAVAVVVVCPLMHVLVAHHTTARDVTWNPVVAGGWVGPNFHLWFLYYLLLCTAPLVALLAVRDRVPAGAVAAFDRAARRFIASPWRVPVLAAAVVPLLWGMPSWLIETPYGWVPHLDVLAYYLGFFAAGAVLARHADLLPAVGNRWFAQLAAANVVVLPAMLGLTVYGVRAEDENPPAWIAAWKAAGILLGGLYTWLMIGGLIGLFRRHFTTSHGAWKYLAGASYWCYLAGFPVQVALQISLAPYHYPIVAEFVVVNVLTFAVLLATYELGVRRTWVGVVLNGKKAVAPAVVVATRVVSPGRAELPAPPRVVPAASPRVAAGVSWQRPAGRPHPAHVSGSSTCHAPLPPSPS